MVHRLNTNKQFMIGNGILAFAVIVIVAVFVYMSLTADVAKSGERKYQELYTISLVEGFDNTPVEIHINDSLLFDGLVTAVPLTVEVTKFADENALLIVDKQTESISTFDLSEQGGTYRLVEKDGKISLLPR